MKSSMDPPQEKIAKTATEYKNDESLFCLLYM